MIPLIGSGVPRPKPVPRSGVQEPRLSTSNRLSSLVKERIHSKNQRKIPIIGENAKWPLQLEIPQIKQANRVA